MKLEIKHIKPCRTDRKKISVEAQINKRLEIKKVFEKLKSEFEYINYSPEMDVIKITRGDMDVLIFNSGQIIIKRAESERVVMHILKEISNLC